jgi:hypothetical protein
MALQPLYRGDDLKFAGLLRYTWTGWASTGEIPQPAVTLDSLKPLWENDGLRLLEHHWQGRQLQLAFSTQPDVTPVFAAGRAKGRFQDALRKAKCPISGFSRMLSVRSVGDNTRRQVEPARSDAHLARQFLLRDLWRVRHGRNPRASR